MFVEWFASAKRWQDMRPYGVGPRRNVGRLPVLAQKSWRAELLVQMYSGCPLQFNVHRTALIVRENVLFSNVKGYFHVKCLPNCMRASSLTEQREKEHCQSLRATTKSVNAWSSYVTCESVRPKIV